MKKLIAIIAILALTTVVFATESDPSETVGFVKYSLVTTSATDLNLVSNSMDMGLEMASDLGTSIGSVDVISKWDNTTQSWISYICGMPFGDFALTSGNSYMVNALGSADWYCVGDLPDPPTFNIIITETTDLNLIMLPLDMSSLAMASDLGTSMGSVDVISEWDNTDQSWISYICGMPFGDYSIDIGQGYMVNATDNFTWPSSDGEGKVTHVTVEKNINQSEIKKK